MVKCVELGLSFDFMKIFAKNFHSKALFGLSILKVKTREGSVIVVRVADTLKLMIRYLGKSTVRILLG